jgi:hypothetical protein
LFYVSVVFDALYLTYIPYFKMDYKDFFMSIIQHPVMSTHSWRNWTHIAVPFEILFHSRCTLMAILLHDYTVFMRRYEYKCDVFAYH